MKKLLLTISLLMTNVNVWADEIDNAFTKLVEGRKFLAKFPSEKTRLGLIDDFLGRQGQTPNRPALMEAVQLGLSIRQIEPVGSQKSDRAQEIAWQALEASSCGYLFSGNKDLLDGVRTAYPGSNPNDDPRQLPVGEVDFSVSSQKSLAYARAYFIQPIKDTLDFIAQDQTGTVRAVGSKYPTVPHYVTFDDEESTILPMSLLGTDPANNNNFVYRFDDPNFGTRHVNPVASNRKKDLEGAQSVAYIYGSAMERLGMAAVAYAEQLWRAAYAGSQPSAARDPAQRQAMLDQATEVLKCDVHAQFLASLPLAAQLPDGSGGEQNQYTLAKIDQGRVSVTDAQRLRDTILAGEKPTQTALVSAWDKQSLEDQIGKCKEKYEAARLKWGGDAAVPADGSVAYELAREEQAETENAQRRLALRGQFETRLFEITGLDPSGYNSLSSEGDRLAYLQAVQDTYDNLINGRDPNAVTQLQACEMTTQALRLIQAMNEADAAQSKIESYPQKIRVELERNDAINTVVVVNALFFGALDAAVHAAHTVKTSVHAQGLSSGTSLTYSQGDAVQAAQAVMRAIRTATENTFINNENSDAVVRNYLIEMKTVIDELPVIKLNSDIAGNELRRLLNQAKRLVEDHVFYQGVTNDLWYRDPQLAFRMEKAEEEYRDLLQDYRVELYVLAKMLEASWIEPFRNPVKNSSGSTVGGALSDGSGSMDGFTEPESIFGTANHVQAERYYRALKAWDAKLRTASYRGTYDPTLRDANQWSGQPISLRRDIFKLVDYRYDFAANKFIPDPQLERDSIQKFRAQLMSRAAQDPANLAAPASFRRLRIDFPLTYNQTKAILELTGQSGLPGPQPIVRQNRPAGTYDQYWNHRVREVAAKIVGKKVFPSGNTATINIDYWGNVDRVGFQIDSLYSNTRAISTFQMPLFQRDPDTRLIEEPFFGTTNNGIEAFLDGASAIVYVPTNKSWPLFCDNIVLRIQSQNGLMRLENIEDIELYFKIETGPPPPVTTAVW